MYLYPESDFATLPIWNSKYSEQLVHELCNYDIIYTYEDHLLSGGFGSWVFEQFQIHRRALIDEQVPKIICNYLTSDVIGLVGDEDYINSIAYRSNFQDQI